MEKSDENAPKKRAGKYDEKVTFDGTFEDMIGISVKDAKKKTESKKIKTMNKETHTFPASESLATLEFKHNMGTKDVIVQVYDPLIDETIDENDLTIIRYENKVALFFSTPPNRSLRVVVIG